VPFFAYPLVKILPDDRYSDRDILHRLERFYGSDRFFGDGQIAQKIHSLPMKEPL
jgi:hypothetical protein